MTPPIALVHLVREANGTGPLASFLASLRRFPPGAPHELVLLLKGFSSDAASAPHRDLAAAFAPRCISVGDDGFDIWAYRRAAGLLEHDRLCFVNSFTEARASNWLALLAGAMDEPGVGLVGASGSWGSHGSMMRFDLGLGGPYRRILGARAGVREVLSPLQPAPRPEAPAQGTVARSLGALRAAWRQAVSFEPFPAPHLRTNGFLIDRASMLALRMGLPAGKIDAYALESGRRSITRQIERSGRRVLVVGADGRAFGPEDWPRSGTFAHGEQENLLLDDNQTRLYRTAGAAQRRVLSRYAWGEDSSPGAERAGQAPEQR